MIDGLMSACCNAQAGEARGLSDGTQQALYRGTDALRELLIMGWDEEVSFAQMLGCGCRILGSLVFRGYTRRTAHERT